MVDVKFEVLRARLRRALRMTPSLRGLFAADGEDLLALDFDFDAEGGANVAALDNAAAHPDVAGKIGSLERIVKSAAAGVADEGMIRAGEAVVVVQPVQVGDVFELAGAERGFAGERPITRGKSWGAGRQPQNSRRNIFTGQAIAHEEIGGGPGLGKFRDVGDNRVIFGGMGQQGSGVRRRGRNFELGSLLRASRFDGFRSR